MTPDEFREQGRRAVEWVASYMERAGDFPVRSRTEPGDVLGALPAEAPEAPEPWDDVFRDLDAIVLPGLTHWQSPRFFGYFPANASGPAIIGELLSAGLGVQGMLWSTSPACTEIETRVLDWLGRLVGLPELFLSDSDGGGGVIQGTASEAALVAMVAARRRARASGSGGGLVAYTSTQAHSSIEKAAVIAGIGRENVRRVPVDGRLRMDPAALEREMERDAAAGRVPFFVAATLGTTSSGAVDPLAAIGRVAARSGAWLHVDAAWAGSALVLPEHRWMTEGVERADTFNFNPHKWLLTNFDCSALWARNSAAITDALSITPEYLKNAASESGRVIDYRDWQVPLGRRFRALKLWLVMRAYGARGLREHVRRGISHGETFESLVRESDRFELACERSLSLVCAAHVDGNAATRRTMDEVNDSGEAFFTHTVLPGEGGDERVVVRLAAGGVNTTEVDVRRAFAALERVAAELSPGGASHARRRAHRGREVRRRHDA